MLEGPIKGFKSLTIANVRPTEGRTLDIHDCRQENRVFVAIEIAMPYCRQDALSCGPSSFFSAKHALLDFTLGSLLQGEWRKSIPCSPVQFQYLINISMTMGVLSWAILLFIAVLLVIRKLSRKSSVAQKTKVFVIGLNKTGTTSLGDALHILGYRRFGWYDFKSRKLFHDWYSDNLDPMIKYTMEFDAFEDLPWPFVYQEMATLYPDAKFVLSLRANEEVWWKSISRHTARRIWIGHHLVYGSYSAAEDKDAYINLYVRHQQQVHKYFKDQPERLLEINIDKGGDWTTLCDFLDISSIPQSPFPKSNSKGSILNADHAGFFEAWDNLESFIERLVVYYWYYGGHPKFIPGKAIGQRSRSQSLSDKPIEGSR